jgi:hypothetical protein
MESAKPGAKSHGWGHIAGRIFMLLLGLVSLYLLAPKLISVLASWPQLKTLRFGWFALAIFFAVLSYVSLWGDAGRRLAPDRLDDRRNRGGVRDAAAGPPGDHRRRGGARRRIGVRPAVIP